MTGESAKVIFEWLKGQPVLTLLFILSVIDVLSGIAAAIVTKKLSSDVSYKGMTRKAVMWMIVGVAAAVTQFSPDIPVLKLTAGFYCFMEGISIFENAGRAGVPIPEFLKQSLSKLNPDESQATVTTMITPVPVVVTTTLVHPAAERQAIVIERDDKEVMSEQDSNG